MVSRALAVGSLAFVGPLHAPELPGFGYVRVNRVDDGFAIVCPVGPDSDGDGPEIRIPAETLLPRVVDPSEATLWPGDYVGHPVAFVGQNGMCIGQWAYGVATRYDYSHDGPTLTVLSASGFVAVKLCDPPRIIKVDPINYALQVGSTTPDMLLNAKELLQQQDSVCVACRKRRGPLPPAVLSLLTIPFNPDDTVPLVRPHDLQVVQVRRQHILDVCMGPRKKSKLDLYKDPQASSPGPVPPSSGPIDVAVDFPPADLQDSILDMSSGSEADDVREVRLQNRSLGKHRRPSADSVELSDDRPSEDGGSDYGSRHLRGSFRPSATQQRVHQTIVNSRFQGKSCQSLLEYMQQSVHVQFLASPPVLRGLYDFGFGTRGLSVMHCRPAGVLDRANALESTTSRTDFSEKNTLRPAASASSRHDICGALRCLRTFASRFYNSSIVQLIDTAISFVDSFKGISDDDTSGWKLVAYWVTNKFGKFRSLTVSREFDASMDVYTEFSRNDEELLEIKDLRKDHRADNHPAPRRRLTPNAPRRGETSRPKASVPPEVLAALPTQGTPAVAPCKHRPVALTTTLNTLKLLEKRASASARSRLCQVASTFHLVPPVPSPSIDVIDASEVEFLSDLAQRSRLSLPEFVRLVRNQTDDDPRPNKALFELPVPRDSPHTTTYKRWNSVVRNGVLPQWKIKPGLQSNRPSNHKFVSEHADRIRAHIRKGQRDGRFLVLREKLLQLWPEIFVSPIGIAAKGDHDVRLINDYSYPRGSSVNDFTCDDNFPTVSYNPPGDIARRIHNLQTEHPDAEVLMMLGDVSGAFRHVPINENAVHMFSFLFGGYLVIDLACGFGWCGSPAFYSLAGSIINDKYEATAPVHAPADSSKFSGNVWCDDHTCVEIHTGTRCRDANIALRRSMLSVLGPSAINDKKFTGWMNLNKALGLLWDTDKGTVAIPENKLEKTQTRLRKLLRAGRATKSELNKLLGVMRHVATCFPAARAFYQRVHVAAISAPPFANSTLSVDVLNDLRWFDAVLVHRYRFNGIPVSQFASLAEPDVHVYMDASDDGLCALELHRKEFIRLKFSPSVQSAFRSGSLANSINVRELQSAVLAALVWGPQWKNGATPSPTHVRLHIDNMSAVVWSSRRLSRHPTAQLYNRLLSLAELQYHLVFTAEHIPGNLNTMADAGSRAWTDSHPLWSSWTNLSSSWRQVPIVAPFDNLSAVWEQCCSDMPWLGLPRSSITQPGASGAFSPA